MSPAPHTPATPIVVVAGKQLRRLRWAVRATLTLGVAASVAANVLHARPNPISQIIAAWPPLALLLTVELISRVPHHRWLLGAIRITAAATIAVIAGWVSYWHLVGVAARYGETSYGAAYLLPISVDGLVIVASVSLVEITARIRAATPRAAAADDQCAAAAPTAHPAGQHLDHRTAIAPDDMGTGTQAPEPVRKPPPDGRAGRSDTDDRAPQYPPRQPTDAPRPSSASRAGDNQGDRPNPASTDDVPPGTAAAVSYWRRRDPTMHPADIAARIGRSERTVRRYWSTAAATGAAHANGHRAGSLRR
ncbi:DUF2637 domain-containing protein [Micromonospora tulbaghiae]|uniref:DUF2637 domain-containing protein n=1 Tax=Micromonospora tulbaghiae TaxID=479978 RepID=UPI003EB7223D